MNLGQRGAGQVQFLGRIGHGTFAVAKQDQRTRPLRKRQGDAGCSVSSQHRHGHTHTLCVQVGQQRDFEIHIERAARPDGAKPRHVAAAIRGPHGVVVVEVAADQVALLHWQAIVPRHPITHGRGSGCSVGDDQVEVTGGG
ncbi:hypothetical protein D3C71_1475130 [compost metagenome]